MAKTFKRVRSEQAINNTSQNLIDDLDFNNQEYEEPLEGKKTKVLLKIMALAKSRRLGTQVKKIRSTKILIFNLQKFSDLHACITQN